MRFPFGRSPKKRPEQPITKADDQDVIPAREMVPEAFVDLEVHDFDDGDQIRGDQALINALINLLGRTGCDEYVTRVESSQFPWAFVFAARWDNHWEITAGTSLAQAVHRLVQHMVDGGLCIHCQKPTGVARDFEDDLDDEHICWYQMDPELTRFRRSCEGDDEENYD